MSSCQSTSTDCRTLTQVDEMLDEFEETADVDTEELEECAEDLDHAVEKEMDEVETANTPKSSSEQARRYSDRFKEFLRAHKLCDKIEQLVPQTLNRFLRFYYRNLRGKSGEYLAPSTLGCIRAGIHRYLTSAPLNRAINIIEGVEFQSANKMLRVIGALYLKTGGCTMTFPAIEPADMVKVAKYLDR